MLEGTELLPIRFFRLEGVKPVPYLFLIDLAAGAIVAVLVLLWLIAWQRRRALGQQIYEDAPSSHLVKQGTPTMGGLAFVAAAIAGTVLFWPLTRPEMPSLLLLIAAAAIGLADDYLKLTLKRALGLRARTKFALLFLVACAFVAWEARNAPFGNAIYQQLWFGESGWAVLPAWLWAALSVVAIVGAANAVNLTDGLDGLATGAMLPPLLFLENLWSMLAVPVVGACLTFLFFNRHPARIFMGDTGSLALGALLGGLAVQHGALLVLPLIGVVFVAEALSVILQVAWFKITSRRIFKMSPLHHHFELSGWKEWQITLAFTAVSVIAVIAVGAGLSSVHAVMGTGMPRAE